MFDRVHDALAIGPSGHDACGICSERWHDATLTVVRGFHVTVSVPPMSVAPRGHYLLQMERHLRATVDPQIEVFLEPTADANKLRQRLRGVKVE